VTTCAAGANVAALGVGVPNVALLLGALVDGAFGGGPETVGGLFAASSAFALSLYT